MIENKLGNEKLLMDICEVNLLQDKALKVVEEWMDSYGYKIVDKKQENTYLDMIVEDLQYYDEEDKMIDNTLDYWCKFFIEEINSKDAEEFVLVEWKEEDVKPMQQYLDRYKKEVIKEFNNEELLRRICDSFEFELTINEDGSVTQIDEHANVLNDSSITMALMEWLGTLDESCWSEEIEYIRYLEKEYDKDCESAFTVTNEEIKEEVEEVVKEVRTKLDLGESMVDAIKGEDFYSNVKWEMIDNYFYELIAKEFSSNVECLLDFLGNEDFCNCSDQTYDFIKCVIDCKLEYHGYVFDDYEVRFVPKKTMKMASDLLNENGTYYSWNEDENKSLKVELDNGDFLTVEIGDEYEYMVSYNNSTCSHFGNNETFIEYINNAIENTTNYEEEDFEVNNTIQVKYDVKLEVIESDGETYKIKPSVPLFMVAEDRIQDVERLIFIKEGDKYLLQCAINKYTIAKENIKYFVGIDSAELYEVCDNLCDSYIKVPNSYVKIEGKYYEVNSLVDFIKLNIIEDVYMNQIEHRFNFKGANLLNGIMEYYGDDYTLYETQKEVNDCLMFCDNNVELFEEVCDKVVNYDFSSFKEGSLLIGEYVEDIAREYLESALITNLDSQNIFEYINHEEYFKDNVDYETIQGYIVVEL